MRHQATQALYAYWNEVRRDRLAPRRLEIQPARIGDILLDTFILERAGAKEFRFRLAGTRVSSRFGIDLRAQDFLACWREADRALFEHHLEAIGDLGRVGLFTGEGETVDERGHATLVTFELLVLPLVHTGQSIDRLLCLLVPLDAPSGRPDAPIQGLRLAAAEAVWPNGHAADTPSLADRQLPLNPNVRLARIVRQGRRQFRVYEGGLVAHAADGKAS
jgi:hypothetical protein